MNLKMLETVLPLISNVGLIGIIIYFIYKNKMLKIKYVCLGFVEYFITQVIYSLLLSFTLVFLNIQLYTVIKVLLLVLVFVIVKLVLYKNLYKPNYAKDYVSLGLGVGLNTYINIMMPTIFNNLIYSIAINNGSIYQKMMDRGYSMSEITGYLEVFGANSQSYYMFTAICCLIPLLLHIGISLLIKKDTRLSFIILFGIGLESIYYLIPIYDYLMANVFIFAIIICLMIILKRKMENFYV